MAEYFVKLSDFSRSYLSEDFLIFAGGIPGLIGFFLMLTSFFYSILRINRAMRRDGIESPSLHWLSIIGYMSLFAASRKSIAKQLKAEKDAGVTSHLFLLSVTIVMPYIKPIDRIISRVMFFLAGVCSVFILIHMWLYPN